MNYIMADVTLDDTDPGKIRSSATFESKVSTQFDLRKLVKYKLFIPIMLHHSK